MYRASVIVAAPSCLLGVVWPIKLEAIRGETPAASSQVAAVCRHSWRVIGSSFAACQRLRARLASPFVLSSPDFRAR